MENLPCARLCQRVRETGPLVHHITNDVTINDCANITLCIGAAPVMTKAAEEVAEMVSMAGALVLNIGTLTRDQITAMICAGTRANECGIPIVLDPVGAGATTLRTESTLTLLDELDIAVLKGNAGEIGCIAGAEATVRGVDSGGLTGDPISVARDCARTTKTVVAMSGATDIVTDGHRTYCIENGHPLMGRLSGTGCMVASVTGAFVAVEPDYLVAATAALTTFCIAGELAAAEAKGPYSFRTALFDTLANLRPEEVAGAMRVRADHAV